MTHAALEACRALMIQEGLPEAVVATFAHHHRQVAAGATGQLREADLRPAGAGEVSSWASVAPFQDAGREALAQTAVIKLNGGLGTTMGLRGPKGALVVKEGHTFFDLAAVQVIHLNRRHRTRVPFLTMDSFATRARTAELRQSHPALPAHVSPAFLQNKYPKLLVPSLEPARWHADPELAWNPPGHGDFYAAIADSGVLAELRSQGIRYAFVSNIDNLGATLDPAILGWFAAQRLPFLMEVCHRGPMDRKGGHLAVRRSDGQLLLRERAQTAPEDLEAFEDTARHVFFNTNNLWIDLVALEQALARHAGILPLDVILNRKRLVPKDERTPEVYQLETAIGAAIAAFPGAKALEVPRHRLIPVKNCEDLLVVLSDRYTLEADGSVRPALEATPTIRVQLEEAYFGTLDRLHARLDGVPSLKACRSLVVTRDIRLSADLRLEGDVTL